MIHDSDDGAHADAIEVLKYLFADRIRSWGYDPDGSGPEDVAEAVSVAVVDAALVWLEAVDPAELLPQVAADDNHTVRRSPRPWQMTERRDSEGDEACLARMCLTD